MTTPGEKSEGLQSSALAAPTDGSENTRMTTADLEVVFTAASPRYELNSLPEPAKSVSSSVEAPAAVISIAEPEVANQLDAKAHIRQQCQDSTSRSLHFDHTVSVTNVYPGATSSISSNGWLTDSSAQGPER